MSPTQTKIIVPSSPSNSPAEVILPLAPSNSPIPSEIKRSVLPSVKINENPRISPYIQANPIEKYEIEQNLGNQRELHENKSTETPQKQGWLLDKNYLSSFVKLYASLFNFGDTKFELNELLIQKSSPTPKASIKLTKQEKILKDITELEQEHYADIETQLTLVTAEETTEKILDDDDFTYLSSCSGIVDPITKEDITPFNGLIIGSGVGKFAELIAKKYPESTFLCFEKRNEFLSIHQERIYNQSISNTYICNNPLTSNLAYKLGTSNGFFRFQFILDLIPLLDELLPHEFEYSLGHLFSTSQTSFVFIPDDRQEGIDSHLEFFNYWKSFKELILNACSKVGLPEPKIQFLSQHSVYRVDLVHSFTKKLNNLCLQSNSTHCTSDNNILLHFDSENIFSGGKSPVAFVDNYKNNHHSICNGFPLRYLLDFDLIPQHSSLVASRLAYSNILNVPENDDKFSYLFPSLGFSDLVYVNQNNFVLAPFAKPNSLYITSTVNNDDDYDDDMDSDLLVDDDNDDDADIPHLDDDMLFMLQDFGFKDLSNEKTKKELFNVLKNGFEYLNNNKHNNNNNLPLPTPSPFKQGIQPPSKENKEKKNDNQSEQNDISLSSLNNEDNEDYEDDDENWKEKLDALFKVKGIEPTYSDNGNDKKVIEFTQYEEYYNKYANYFPKNDDDGNNDDIDNDNNDFDPVKPNSRKLFAWDGSFGNFNFNTVKPSPSPLPKPLSSSFSIFVRDRTINEFNEIWDLLLPHINQLSDTNGLWLIPESRTGFLPSKLAKRFPKATILSIESSPEIIKEQKYMISILGLKNSIFLCNSNYYDRDTLSELSRKSTIARYQILNGKNIFSLLNTMTMSQFTYNFALSLSLSGTTFIHLPDYNYLQFTSSLLQIPFTNENSMKSFLESILETSGIVQEFEIENITPPPSDTDDLDDFESSSLWKITIIKATRSISIGSQSYSIQYGVKYNHFRVDFIDSNSMNSSPIRDIFAFKVDLGSLLHLHVTDDKQKQLIQFYLHDLEIKENMHPSTLFSDYTCKLYHYSPFEEYSVQSDQFKSSVKVRQKENQIRNIIGDKYFSFLHINSGNGEFSSLLAQTSPNSTIISIDSQKENQILHEEIINEYKIYNNLACRKTINRELIDIIRSSPEFFQYVMISNFTQILQSQLTRQQELQFLYPQTSEYLSRLISLGITSFIELPSSKIISLIISTFYGNELAQIPLLSNYYYPSTTFSFLSDDHPITPWEHSGVKVLSSLINDPGIHEVDISELPQVDPSVEIIQVKLVNMSRTVGHHLRLPEHTWKELHSRKYDLNHVNGETFLIRTNDDSRITYDKFGISLVAALRLGVSQETKSRLYDQFIKIPIFEDMAPWNIQFRAGQLEYVDKDSSEESFDWILPYGYQFIIALMNWRESISNFEKCSSPASVIGGPPVIGDCVNSSTKVICKDPENPVPCADDNCYPSFVDCLRALSELEENFIQNFNQSFNVPTTNNNNIPPNPDDTRVNLINFK